MIELHVIIAILVAHYIGDWLLQVPFQAVMGRKSSDWSHLTLHCATLVLPLVVVGVIFMEPSIGFAWALGNAWLHFLIDAVSSRMTSRYHKQNKMSHFWLTIGTDQVMHLIILFGSWSVLHGI